MLILMLTHDVCLCLCQRAYKKRFDATHMAFAYDDDAYAMRALMPRAMPAIFLFRHVYAAAVFIYLLMTHAYATAARCEKARAKSRKRGARWRGAPMLMTEAATMRARAALMTKAYDA